jgi:hypothetical protein
MGEGAEKLGDNEEEAPKSANEVQAEGTANRNKEGEGIADLLGVSEHLEHVSGAEEEMAPSKWLDAYKAVKDMTGETVSGFPAILLIGLKFMATYAPMMNSFGNEFLDAVLESDEEFNKDEIEKIEKIVLGGEFSNEASEDLNDLASEQAATRFICQVLGVEGVDSAAALLGKINHMEGKRLDYNLISQKNLKENGADKGTVLVFQNRKEFDFHKITAICINDEGTFQFYNSNTKKVETKKLNEFFNAEFKIMAAFSPEIGGLLEEVRAEYPNINRVPAPEVPASPEDPEPEGVPAPEVPAPEGVPELGVSAEQIEINTAWLYLEDAMMKLTRESKQNPNEIPRGIINLVTHHLNICANLLEDKTDEEYLQMKQDLEKFRKQFSRLG